MLYKPHVNIYRQSYTLFITLILIFIFIFIKPINSQSSIVQSTTEIKITEELKVLVKETYEIVLVGKENIDKYESIRKNSNLLDAWHKFLGDKFYLKIKSEYIDNKKLTITPSAYRDFTAIDETAYATLVIEYETIDLFKINQIKPRTFSYEFTGDVLNYQRTSEDQIYLSDREYLKIALPNNLKKLEVQPQNYELTNNNTYTWSPRQGALPNFKVSFEKQISVYEEIEKYYKKKINELSSIISDKDFIYWLLVFIFFLIAYILLKTKKIL
ncbi:MAG: hypothetical protein N3E37_03525 [Candidatus Micrarchaeota archaeon]|nr:hypothetical protein [Candidatus Micrarchaeota archaeon]